MTQDVLDASVIVPVYNPGSDIDDCIRTLLDQSLAPEAYEVIFVDDGSTDGTSARLDELAAVHSNVRVEHIPNSGWPGKPRNVGIEMARGEFLYFVDNDDWLEHDALEQLVSMARRTGADVVVGKVVGHGKYVPRGLFVRSRDEITLDSNTLLGLLTPHKLFRRTLLDEHRIRFPEGRRRLEDHVFVMHAFFHAARISVLADRPIYHWVLRDGDANASFRAFDPVGYYENVREVLDLIAEHTSPGPLRDRLGLHWYRSKMLQRVGGRGFPKRPAEYRRGVHEEVRKLALERFPPEVADSLPFVHRLRSRVLREGSLATLERLAEMEAEVRGRVNVVASEDAADGVRVLRWNGRLNGSGGPLPLRAPGERVYWVPPATMSEALPPEWLDVTGEVSRASVRITLRNTADRSEFVLPGEMAARLVPLDGLFTVELSGSARIDPHTAAAGSPLPAGDWEVLAVVDVLGFAHTTKLRRGVRRAPVIVTSTGDGLAARPRWLTRVLAR